MTEQIIENASNSEMRCAVSRDRIYILEQKRAGLETARSELEAAIEEAEKKNQTSVAGFMCDDNSQEKVKNAELELSEATQELKRVNNLLASVDHEIHVEKGRLDVLEGERAHNAGNVWNFIYARMAQDLLKRMSHEIVFLYAANRRQRRPLNYSYFLESLFPEPNRNIINAITPDLDTLYKEVLLGEAKKSKKGK